MCIEEEIKNKKKEEGATRTNTFLPVGVSANGFVGSASFTVSFSGSLSPGLTCCVARSCATCAWAVLAASVARLAMLAIFGISGLARFGWYLSAVLIYVACDGN